MIGAVLPLLSHLLPPTEASECCRYFVRVAGLLKFSSDNAAGEGRAVACSGTCPVLLAPVLIG